jgi:hypothetical protein
MCRELKKLPWEIEQGMTSSELTEYGVMVDIWNKQARNLPA